MITHPGWHPGQGADRAVHREKARATQEPSLGQGLEPGVDLQPAEARLPGTMSR